MKSDKATGITCGGNGLRPSRSTDASLPIFSKGLKRTLFFVAAAVLLLSSGNLAEAASVREGVFAFNRQDYTSASRIFIPLAEQGDPAAQSYLGFMFET